jgi:uncharacterized protein YjbJ (UPF0337 family)
LLFFENIDGQAEDTRKNNALESLDGYIVCGYWELKRKFRIQGENRMNSDQLQGKWKQIKGSVKERWGKLTDDDIEVINGKHYQLVGKIQERYGIARDAAQKQVDEWNAVESHQSDSEQRRKAS